MTDKQTVESAIAAAEAQTPHDGMLNNMAHDAYEKATTALTNLYDKAELIEWLEGEKKSYAMDNTLQEYNEGYNASTDTVITKIKEM